MTKWAGTFPRRLFDHVHELPLDPVVLEHEPDVSGIVASNGAYVEGVRRLFRSLDG